MPVYWIWLSLLPDLSLRQKNQILQHFSDAEELYFTEPEKLEELPAEVIKALSNKDLAPAEKVLRICTRKNIGILTWADAQYPRRLRNIADPPVLLYYSGTIPDWEHQPIIAVVGTRKASPYGISAAKKLSRQITACGGMVISGCASGIDGAAMQGALDIGSNTVGVLGNGVDVVYPRTNRGLYGKVVKGGCLLSEYEPGSRPERWHFPQRNRILSGIADGVLVIEAPERSGALITARCALEQGRDVFAVPGNIDAPTCEGSNALLQDGAITALNGWDIMKEYEAHYPNVVGNRKVPLVQESAAETVTYVAQKIILPMELPDKKDIDKPAVTPYSGIEKLTEEEQKLLACLTGDPKPVDDVIAVFGQSSGKTLSMLTKLALQGLVQNHPGRLVSRKER
ncbi:MAG: DNA-processing protein DprA [Oscillospiraceae bacterium]|nr:DNA-processing protein DprA [Oscillospiraceae bacterium]